MTNEEAYKHGCNAGWTTALTKVLWEVKFGKSELSEVVQILLNRGPADPDFGYPITMVENNDQKAKQ